jgi:hypothetical protein
VLAISTHRQIVAIQDVDVEDAVQHREGDGDQRRALLDAENRGKTNERRRRTITGDENMRPGVN